ncbi:MAG: peptidoglycan bridge formation glycyltransferase FemA/FemB family protein [Chloroflexi bacterium]|nr:peptidoglycan bridge formation glycyltransferase FemA/FemB family protein [Chloroflexota bacterium]
MSPLHPFTSSPVHSSTEWDSALTQLPHPHLLQCWAWGEFKAKYGWSARRIVWKKNDQPIAAAQILKRIVGPFSILYVPRGPLLDWNDHDLAQNVLRDLENVAKRERAVFIKIDPEIDDPSLTPLRFATGASVSNLQLPITNYWFLSQSQVQFKNTVWLDLTPSEDEIIASFKQKTRYNIRLAERKGVTVEMPSADEVPFELLYKMYAETSLRDGFVIRHENYYRDAWGNFIRLGQAQPFIARVGGDPVAAIIVFRFADRALYMYGMSRNLQREKMPNHLLQWRAMQWAKSQGCAIYDFWGAPDVLDETDRLYGVWKFKEGFSDHLVRLLGAIDYAPSPMLYNLYTFVLPRVLNVMRRRGIRQTSEVLETSEVS